MEVTAQTTLKKKFLTPAQSEIIRTLVYFNIFRHPLTKVEIERFCRYAFKNDELKTALDDLLNNNLIFSDGFCYLIQKTHHVIEYRKLGNQRAEKIMPAAKRYSKLISAFPFVRGVFISGSLSKGVMQADSDLDFFVITSPERLWLCRTLLIFYKKVFLLNSHKYFCLNYFITEKNLSIPDQNLFTAIELVTLLPMYNVRLYEEFLVENKWALDYFPNAVISYKERDVTKLKHPIKNFIEKIFSNKAGNVLDITCQRFTNYFWKNKYSKNSKIDFENSIRSSREVSKYHPNHFQHKTLSLLENGLQKFEAVTGFKLSK